MSLPKIKWKHYPCFSSAYLGDNEVVHGSRIEDKVGSPWQGYCRTYLTRPVVGETREEMADLATAAIAAWFRSCGLEIDPTYEIVADYRNA